MRRSAKDLTEKQLKNHLLYNATTGQFKWRQTTLWHEKGPVEIRFNAGGYQVITLRGYPYLAHRLAWLYTYGHFPDNGLDHRDRNRSNNAIINLREASCQCNVRNSRISKTNISGIKGVSYKRKQKKKWLATIVIDNVQHYLGNFDSFIEAAYHRLAAEQCLDWGNCDTRELTYKKLVTLESLEKYLGRDTEGLLATLAA